jgi:hypothetical protein
MMKAIDIRECNRLEKNSKRCEKARKLLQMVAKTNEVSDLDINNMIFKLGRASDEMMKIRRLIMKN